MAVNHQVIGWLAKQAASKTYKINKTTGTSMNAAHGSKPTKPSNTQSPHRLGRRM